MKKGFGPLAEAFSLLTVLPMRRSGVQTQLSSAAMIPTLVWFPIVGAVVGALSGVAILSAAGHWSASVASLFGLAAAALITGGLHLDGFSDTMDGLGAWKGREETLRIMQDSRVGAIGAVGLILLLFLKWSLFQQAAMDFPIRILAAVCSLSRLSLVFSAQFFPYVPGRMGMGSLVTDARSRKALIGACGLAAAIAFASVGFPFGAVSLAVTGLVAWGLNRFFVARLGGITGDTLGALNEVVEVVLLLVLTSR